MASKSPKVTGARFVVTVTGPNADQKLSEAISENQLKPVRREAGAGGVIAFAVFDGLGGSEIKALKEKGFTVSRERGYRQQPIGPV